MRKRRLGASFECSGKTFMAMATIVVRGGARAIDRQRLAPFVYVSNIRPMIDLTLITGFDWDDGNIRKNERHGVSVSEAEQVFFNQPLLVLEDVDHSQDERRYHALGRTQERRLLHITFTLRSEGSKIRVISARDMHRKERTFYEQAT
jgi:uncharacterized DUF497 family protein